MLALLGSLKKAVSAVFTTSNSLRFRASNSAYLSRTPSTAGNQTIWTWSGWVKRGSLGSLQTLFDAYTNGSNASSINFTASDQIQVSNYVSASLVTNKITTAVFRDSSSWYHVVISSNAASALNVYVNGSQITSFATNVGPTATNWFFNGANAHMVGRESSGGTGTQYFDGYLTEVNFIDGQALTPSSFGQISSTTGVWSPKAYTGTYGTNGFYLKFADASAATAAAIGKDSSGNGNNWTPSGISVTAGATYDSMIDVPTNYADGGNGRGNYATLNPLNSYAGSLSGGNLNLINPSSGNWFSSAATQSIPLGKFYWEINCVSVGATGVMIGIAPLTQGFVASAQFPGSASSGLGYYSPNGNKYINGAATAYGATYTTSDIIGVALDTTSGNLTFYKNNITQGSASTTIAGDFVPAISVYDAGAALSINFGQRPFNTANGLPPTGFVALNTQNLPAPAIADGKQHFDVVTSKATVPTGITISSLAFSPGLMWRKNRDNAEHHYLVDVIRGTGNGGFLSSDLTSAAGNYPSGVGGASDGTLTFNSNGYTITDSDWNNGEFYFNNRTYVDWIWKAGGTAVSNTAGTITSQVSANTTAGFSVVTYTGTGANATVGHGLGVAPAFIIIKDRTAARTTDQWPTYHSKIGATGGLVYLNSTGAGIAASTVWNNTNPTSTVFSIGTWGGINYSTDNFVAYCFAEIAGFSKFGSYTGNGSADGPFVYCGFRPRFVLIKCTTTAGGSWIMYDSGRDQYNLSSAKLASNLAENENGATVGNNTLGIDLLSNGFKNRNDGGVNHNATGATYIFAAFAENPSKYALAR